MIRKAHAAFAFLLLLGSSAAGAVSVTNRDDQDHKITIIEGETKTDKVLKPTQVLEGLCPKGCVLRLNDSEDDEYELEVNDVVSIEEGSLYYDGPDAEPKTGPGAEPPAKK
jgi:hypothetical protein